MRTWDRTAIPHPVSEESLETRLSVVPVRADTQGRNRPMIASTEPMRSTIPLAGAAPVAAASAEVVEGAGAGHDATAGAPGWSQLDGAGGGGCQLEGGVA